MSVVGSLVFCKNCGSLLDCATDADVVSCGSCPATYPAAPFKSVEVTTRSPAGSFPSLLRQKRSVVQVPTESAVGGVAGAEAAQQLETESRATIEEPCPKCNNPQMTFFTLQLRSADEGSTVFYECPKCAYKFSTNN